MAVAKDKKRVVITLSKESLATAKATLSTLGEAKLTLSELIEISLGFFLESALNEVKKRREARKDKQDNA